MAQGGLVSSCSELQSADFGFLVCVCGFPGGKGGCAVCNRTGVICKPEEAFATVTISPAQALVASGLPCVI